MKKRQPKILRTLQLTLPTCWGDLTPGQVVRVAYYLSLGLDESEFLVRLGIDLAGLQPHGSTVGSDGEIRYVYYHRPVGNVTLTAEHLAAIASALKWVTDVPEPMAAPDIPGYGQPDRDLFGITLEQFLVADAAYTEYIRSKESRALLMLAASMYPRSGRFSAETLERDAPAMQYLFGYRLEAIVLWFTGAKRLLMRKYPCVFSEEEAGSEIPQEDVLLGLLSSLNNGRIVDNEKIKRTDVHEVFYELNQKIKASKRQK